MFLIVIIASLLIAKTTSQIQLTNGQTYASSISPGEIISFSVTIPNSNTNIIVEIGGNSMFANSQTISISPPVPLQPFISTDTFISSIGEDINGIHNSGSVCPSVSQSGVHLFNVTTRSSSVEPYSVRVSWKNPDLTQSLTYSGPLCCEGSEYLAFDIFTFNVDTETISLKIVGERTSDKIAFGDGPDMGFNLGDCTNPTFQTFLYREQLPDNGPFEFIIDQNSNPPLEPGLYYISVRRGLNPSPVLGDESITFFICPNGICPEQASTIGMVSSDASDDILVGTILGTFITTLCFFS